MNTQEYQTEATKTLAGDVPAILNRVSDPKMINALHGAIGICTEGGELLDAYKKHIYYGKPLDESNVLEEVGDIFWYCNAVLTAHGFTFEQAMQTNINKLQARYKNNGFTEANAINRDLKTEGEILSEGANA